MEQVCFGPTVQNASSTIFIPYAPQNKTIADWLVPLGVRDGAL